MPSENIYTLIKFDDYSVTPKYLQLANSILKCVETGKLEEGYILPSINNFCFELDIGRNTVEKAYKHLKRIGIINSVPGKGYFIDKTDVGTQIRVFLIFNKLSVHKKIMYDAFIAALGEYVVVDFYIYNNDFALFKKLLGSRQEEYSHYVIIPHFLEGGENAHEIINAIPRDKLILLDKKIPGIEGEYAAVYENFEQDIYRALGEAREPLSKYHTIKVIFPGYTYHPVEILKGCSRFCQEYAFNFKVVHSKIGRAHV